MTKQPSARRGRPKKPDYDAGKAPNPSAPGGPGKKPGWVTKFSDMSQWNGSFANPEENRLHIPKDVVEALAREGVAIQWVTETVYGQPQDHRMSVMRRNHWQEVQPGELPGVDVVAVDGLRLMARPMEIHQRAKSLEKSGAQERVATMEASHRGHGVDVPGGEHPSALRFNKHAKSIEKIEIPRE